MAGKTIPDLLRKYVNMTGIKVDVYLKDGRKIRIRNAIIKNDCIINDYYQDMQGMLIPYDSIEYLEMYVK